MKKLMIASTLLIASLAQANVAEKITIETVELPLSYSEKALTGGTQVGGSLGGGVQASGGRVGGGITTFPSASSSFYPSFQDTSYQSTTGDKVGQVISTAKDIVALGEAVYTLVQKGKPSNTTEYAPISIVPRDPMTKEYADPFDLENCSMPVTKKFKTTVKSGPKVVVNFDYMIVYSVGCSYNGAGKYISSASVIPSAVKTSFGWDFSASMKLSGIMNHGTKVDTVAGAILTIKYQMNSWTTSFERNDTIYITGRGELKTLTGN